jgi:hypothetical protein
MILQTKASRSRFLNLLEQQAEGIYPDRPFAGLRRLRFSFFPDEPVRLSRSSWPRSVTEEVTLAPIADASCLAKIVGPRRFAEVFQRMIFCP